MRAAIVTAPRRMELVEFPEPAPVPGVAVCEILYCGVCGTDLHGFVGPAPYNPAICGHEWVGVVAATGAGVTGVTDGDRVVIGVQAPCGSCAPCAAGRPQYCAPMWLGMVGRDAKAPPHGGFAPRVAIDAGRLVRVPPSLTHQQAAIVEPATVALHAVRRTPVGADETVIVQGCGPIGLLVVQCLRAYGAANVVAIEPHATRRELAAEVGAHAVLTPAEAIERFGRAGADMVFECAGTERTVQSAVDLVRQGAVVNLVGLASGDAAINPGSWLRKEVTVIASLGYERQEFAFAMDLIADGMPVERIHDRTVSLDELPEAIALLADEPTSATKILVDPRR